MKIQLKPSGILWLSVLFYLSPASAISFLAAILIHELGHIAALLLLGKQPEQLTISISGCVISAYGLTYREELCSAAAGPFMSLMGGLFYPRFPGFAQISLALAVYNLLPIEGLDGGRILSAGLAASMPQHQLVSERISRITAVVITLSAWLCACMFPHRRLFLLIGTVFLLKVVFLIVSPETT